MEAYKSKYDRKDSQFSNHSSFAILKDGALVGTVNFYWSKAGTVYAYIHEHSFCMIDGKAGGYGYDKQGAAISDAVQSALKCFDTKESPLYKALSDTTYNGEWQNDLRSAGYIVFQTC